ncbi:MAG: HAD-IA family hydrolase [Phascolarctobacterium sp.]|nr:HAD-IA family hydrolase [Phascolarctobacterium sp.]
MKYTTIIFDLDGTLLNTLDDLATATNWALKANNFPERNLEEVRWFVGNGMRRLIEQAVPSNANSGQIEKVMASFNEYYATHTNEKTDLYPGVKELLIKLREAGCKTAIVSNKPDYGVQNLMKQYFDGLVDGAMGEHPPITRKPAPDMVLAIIKELGAELEDCIYVGDSDVDVATARNANIPCIGACWGFRGKEFLIEQGCELLADTLEDVYKFIE